jgi:D-aspartate ligase
MTTEHGVASPQQIQQRASAQYTVPVVVVGGSLNALGVVRSLAVGQMPIHILESSRDCPGAWTRYGRYRPIPSHEGVEFVEAMERIGNEMGCRPVLILTSDSSVNCVSEYRSRLDPLFRITLPSAEMVRVLGDKILFQQLAEREGFAVPRSLCLASDAELDQLDHLTPPLIAKPADKRLVLNGVAERAVRAESIEEARRAGSDLLQHAGRIVFQEWVDGPDSEIYFTLFCCSEAGEVLGLFAGRKLRCTPPAIGNTAVCVAAPAELEADLNDPTLEFIQRVAYRGLGSLEFKRDVRTGRFVMIEPTVGRTDWQEEIATLCGINLPLISYCSALGLPVPAAQRPAGSLAWRSSVEVGIPLGPAVRTVDGYFRWSDPLPALFFYGYERGARRLWRKATGRQLEPR